MGELQRNLHNSTAKVLAFSATELRVPPGPVCNLSTYLLCASPRAAASPPTGMR